MKLGASVLLAAALLPASCRGPAELIRVEDCVGASDEPGPRILAFSRTAGYRHESIAAGVAALQSLGRRHGFVVEHTEAAASFHPDSLVRFQAVVFLNTTGDVLDSAQQEAFEGYIRAGGGFVGVHAAADTEYDWPWYGQLVGAYFRSHPHVQSAEVHVRLADHASTRCLPVPWVHIDEWYDFRAAPAGVAILATVDESSYEGATMGEPHPVAWYQSFEGGRAWYTALGHTVESYADPAFRAHLAGGILWAAGRVR